VEVISSHPLDRSRLRVVLVRARNPNNIGAVARAMHDFGFTDLRLVNDYPVPLEAARSAIDASAVLQASSVAQTLAEAVAGCTLVVGTTAVGERDIQHTLLSLSEAAPAIQSEAARPDSQGRVALLFGSEKTGLSNDELSHCDLLLTIPMARHEGLRHPSMNLGQAVAVCLWELIRPGPPIEPTTRQPTDAAEIERVNDLLYEVLEATEYTRRHGARSDPAEIRRLVHRMSLGTLDAQVWLGILRQILWKIRRP
jgi:TrmH family RNA methyltransferase